MERTETIQAASYKRHMSAYGQLRKVGRKSKNAVLVKGKQNMIILAAMAVLILIFFALNPNFLKMSNVVSMTQSLAPYAIMALGVTFVIATGVIDLSIGTVCIACSVLAGTLYTSGMPLWLVIPVMIALGTLFGVLNGILVAKLKMPAFIATLGTMMFARGISAIIVSVPNVFYPTGTWFNSVFSNANGFPIGLVWVLALAIVCMVLMYKTKVGRYILAIGSNEEATRLSGVRVDRYKIIAFTLSGMFAGIAAIFWSAAFSTVASATGNGMELDAIAGVYIGGTSASGGIASIAGSVIGSLILVVIRNGLNLTLGKFDIQINSTYLTFAITGIIVVVAVLMDVIKTKNMNKVRTEKLAKKYEAEVNEQIRKLCDERDYVKGERNRVPAEHRGQLAEIDYAIRKLQADKKRYRLEGGNDPAKLKSFDDDIAVKRGDRASFVAAEIAAYREIAEPRIKELKKQIRELKRERDLKLKVLRAEDAQRDRERRAAIRQRKLEVEQREREHGKTRKAEQHLKLREQKTLAAQAKREARAAADPMYALQLERSAKKMETRKRSE